MKQTVRIIITASTALLFVIIFFNSFPLNYKTEGLSEAQYAAYLETEVPGLLKENKIPGAVIALVHEGRISWMNAWGYADSAAGRLMTVDTICRAESVSKSLTAWGVLRLAEQGLIELDAPLEEYLSSWQLPDSGYKSSGITVRRLLSANAGMPLGPIMERWDPADSSRPPLREMLSRHAVPFKDPGSGFYYSNVGFALLELMIEDVTGRDFAEYMKTEVLEPLGMNSSTFEWDESLRDVVPSGYRQHGESVPVYLYSERASGGLFTTAEDIARFTIAGMLSTDSSARVLSDTGIALLYEPAAEIGGYYGLIADYYGFGHFIEDYGNGFKAVAHGGQGAGLMTYFMSVPATGDAIVLLTNSQRSWPFMSWLLTSWGGWAGLPTVGMGIIAKSLPIVWSAIGGLCFAAIWLAWGWAADLRARRLRFAPFERIGLTGRLVKICIGLFFIAGVVRAETLDYFFLYSVYPAASVYFEAVLVTLSAVLIVSACFVKKNCGDDVIEYSR